MIEEAARQPSFEILALFVASANTDSFRGAKFLLLQIQVRKIANLPRRDHRFGRFHLKIRHPDATLRQTAAPGKNLGHGNVISTQTRNTVAPAATEQSLLFSWELPDLQRLALQSPPP